MNAEQTQQQRSEALANAAANMVANHLRTAYTEILEAFAALEEDDPNKVGIGIRLTIEGDLRQPELTCKLTINRPKVFQSECVVDDPSQGKLDLGEAT